MFNKIFQKNAGRVIVFFLLLSFSVGIYPQEARATLPVVDYALIKTINPPTWINKIANVSSSGSNALTSASTFFSKILQYKSFFKDYVLDPLAWMMAKAALRIITDQTVQWINNDFNGKPGFLSDPSQFGQDVADIAMGEFLTGKGLDWLCSPFSLQIRLALALGGGFGYQPPSCRLSTMIKNATDFVTNNGGAGWDNFISITVNPTSNPYGSFLSAQNQLSIKLTGSVNQSLAELNWGSGFLSFKTCDLYKPRTCLKYKSGSGPSSGASTLSKSPTLALLDNSSDGGSVSSGEIKNQASALDSVTSLNKSGKLAQSGLQIRDDASFDGQNNNNSFLNTPAVSQSLNGGSSNSGSQSSGNTASFSTPSSLQLGGGQNFDDPQVSNTLQLGGVAPSLNEANNPNCEQYAAKECVPGHEKTETPGSMISERLSRTFNMDLEKLGVADEFNEIIGALVGYMFRQAAPTLLGLGKKDSSGSSGVDYINNIQQDMDNQQMTMIQSDFNSQVEDANYSSQQASTDARDQARNQYDPNGTTSYNGESTSANANENLATNKNTTQSSTDSATTGSLAVDGNTSGDIANNSVFISATENNPWWQVDLGQTYFINNIKIWKRTGVSTDEALGHFKITILDDKNSIVWMSDELNAANMQDNNVSLSNAAMSNATSEIPGRYVRIQRTETISKKLQLAEVQVFGRQSTAKITGQAIQSLNLTKDGSTATQNFNQIASLAANGSLSDLKLSIKMLKKVQNSAASYYQDASLSSLFNSLSANILNKTTNTTIVSQDNLNLQNSSVVLNQNINLLSGTPYEINISGQFKSESTLANGEYLLKAEIRNSNDDVMASSDTPIIIGE